MDKESAQDARDLLILALMRLNYELILCLSDGMGST
jgi:hypothetical protein